MRDVLDYLPGIGLPSLMFYFFFWRPWRRVRSAQSWRPTPCVMISSAVEKDATDDGFYTLLVDYEYEIAGHRYSSSRYSFSVLTTAGAMGKRRVARRLASGTTTVCYVNPDDPRDAVIHRGLTWDMVVCAAFAIIFLSVFLFLFGKGAS